MSDIEHLPVRPNIGIQKNNMRRVRPNDNIKILNSSMDPDVKNIISKGNTIDNESQITKEERISKGVKNLRDAEKTTKDEKSSEPPKNQWSSWIIISLAVIIIVLIIIIIYYVIQYNTTILDKTIIPESVIKPSNMIQMQPVQSVQSVQPINSAQQNSIAKPKNFVDPSKNDLMDALKKLNETKLETIPEEKEDTPIVITTTQLEPIEQISPKKIVELTDDEEKENLMETHINSTLEDLIFNDDNIDAFDENLELVSNSDE